MIATSTFPTFLGATATRRARTRVAKKSRRAFTLVELLVVVAGIGLLAAIVVPNYLKARQTTAVGTSKGNLKQISDALELYYTDNQNYPANGNVTPALFQGGVNGATATYLNSTPNSPGQGGGQYVYTTDGVGHYVILDPSTYTAGNLNGIEKATAAGGTVTDAGTACDSTCTHLGYATTTGDFAY